MSERWPGGIISKTAPAPSGPYQDSTAPGVWTLEQQAFWARQGNWPTAGNIDPSFFIENLFSTWLYTGNSGTQNITNGINLSGRGGLVWIKNRSSNSTPHLLWDTVQGGTLSTNTTGAKDTSFEGFFSSSTSGFNLTSTGAITDLNQSGQNYASWTFREQAKFFDIVTYSGNSSTRNISHNLGSVPGMMIIKRLNAAGFNWYVYHRSLGSGQAIFLDQAGAATAVDSTTWGGQDPTSTTFRVGSNANLNEAGGTYVAYLFAHNAGGFGASGNENVISCGSFTTDGGGNATVNLGYEPQFFLSKESSASGDSWYLEDVMRGFSQTSSALLQANSSAAEANVSNYDTPTATGVNVRGRNINSTYIYMAIRRGPMATPTVGTSVFLPSITTSALDNTTPNNRMLAATDLWINYQRSGGTNLALDRLRGWPFFQTYSTAAENAGYVWTQINQTTLGISATSPSTNIWAAGTSQVDWYFKRAPGFFDIVCYTGTGVARTVTHNLGVAPELMIVKQRSGTLSWRVYANDATKELQLNNTDAFSSSTVWSSTTPTSSVFSVSSSAAVNGSGSTYVAYLFASVAGVSKVGSYTGTGTTQVVNCGFTTGARFVLIKRTDSTGDWYAWDSARGIVAGNDPYLVLNSNTGEVTNTDFVDTANSGFEISSTAPAAINATGGTFIFLAIA